MKNLMLALLLGSPAFAAGTCDGSQPLVIHVGRYFSSSTPLALASLSERLDHCDDTQISKVIVESRVSRSGATLRLVIDGRDSSVPDTLYAGTNKTELEVNSTSGKAPVRELALRLQGQALIERITLVR